jgi:gliding motility-associated-like protein
MKIKLHTSFIKYLFLLWPLIGFGQTPPPMGSAADFALFSSSGAVTNVGLSNIIGNVGSNSGGVSGFGNVNGQMHDGTPQSIAAAAALNTAYLNIGSQAPTMFLTVNFGGQTLGPAVYDVPAASAMNGTLVLDGQNNPNACFVFWLHGAFQTGSGATIRLINGAQACNVFWRIDGATDLATLTTFKGTVICDGAIHIASGANIEGRMLSVLGMVEITSAKIAMPQGCGSPTLYGPLAPALNSLECYALFSANGAVTNTGVTHIVGDVGAENGPLTGFNPLFITGALHNADLSTAQAATDLLPLLTYLDTISYDIRLMDPVNFGRSLILTPHVYRMNAAATLTDTVFLDAQGVPSAVFIIQIQGALTTSTYSNVVLLNGAQSSNVFWKINGAVDINDYSIFRGTVVANVGGISLFIGDTLDGRALTIDGAVVTHDVYMAINAGTPTITPNTTSTFCTGGSVILTASSSASYLWSSGQTTQTILVNNSGTFSVNTTSACGINRPSQVFTVTVLPLPNALITASGPLSFCAGDSVTLTSSAGSSYLWSGSQTTQTVKVFSSGTFNVRVTDANNCSATSTITTVAVNPVPVATITPNGPTTFCQGASVILTASNGASYLWSNGAITQSISVSNSGTFDVIVISASNCRDTSAVTAVTVNPNPLATITPSGPTSFCTGGSVVLTASSGASYLWSNGLLTQSILVTTAGTYTVMITQSTGCVNSSPPVFVDINAIPVATITPQSTIEFCQGDSVVLVASSGTSYLWSNAATTQSITVFNSGTYSVTVGSGINCSAISSTVTITVHPTPTAVISTSGPLTFCQGDSVVLFATFSNSYLWSDGSVAQSIAVYKSGTYNVRVTSTVGCSAISSEVTISVNTLPVAQITPNGPLGFCQGDSVILTASPVGSYLWSSGSTSSSIKVFASGTFEVIVRDGNACTDTSTVTTVVVDFRPTALITPLGVTQFCQGGTVGLSSSLGDSYLWSTSSTNQSIQVGTSGSYFVIVTNSGVCSDTSPVVVITVLDLPQNQISLTGDSVFCEGDSVVLTASPGTSYLWSTGSTTQSIKVFTSGTFQVRVQNADSCFSQSLIRLITVNPNPHSGFIVNKTAKLSYTFLDTSAFALTHNWNFGDNQISTAVNPTHVYATSGTYTVRLIVGNACGLDTAYQVISEAIDLEFFNGFSPNGDGHNDTWRIPFLDYYSENTVKIINRWGSEVWKGSNYDNNKVIWNGENMNGNQLPDGTYFYIIEYNQTNKEGWVIIKR